MDLLYVGFVKFDKSAESSNTWLVISLACIVIENYTLMCERY